MHSTVEFNLEKAIYWEREGVALVNEAKRQRAQGNKEIAREWDVEITELGRLALRLPKEG